MTFESKRKEAVIIFFLLVAFVYLVGFYVGTGFGFIRAISEGRFFNVKTVVVSQEVKKNEERERLCRTFAEVLETKMENVCLAMEVAEREGIDPLLFLALIYTESNFRENVVSSKGYHGLAQIPWQIPWSDINLTIGARIFKEKLERSGNNTIKALILYKGYPLKSKKGYSQAVKVMRLRKYLQLVMVDRGENKAYKR